jgi:hypothetical protein
MNRLALLATTPLLLVVGCAESSGAGGAPQQPFAIHHGDAGVGDGASLNASLVLGERCLTVVDQHGQTWVPVFPAGQTAWRSDELLYDDEVFGHGDRVSLGGGEAAPEYVPAYVPPGCPGDRLWVVTSHSIAP